MLDCKTGSPVVSVAQVGYQYIGCYTISDITFKKQENFNEQFTPEKCIDFCKEANHLYSGLHYGSSCYCWDSSPPQTSKVTEGECFSRCSADITKFCGGPSTMTAYMTSGDMEVNSSQGKPKKPQGCMISKTTVNGGQTCSNTVVFEESFSKSLSKKQWSHIVEIGEQPECPFVFFNSVGANSYTSNDKLIIKPSILPEDMVRNGALNLTECTARDQKRCAKKAVSFSILPPIQTARLTTKNSFSFLYGKIEVLAKLPIGDWIVPEIWLQPKTNSYGPDYISGQINIALSRGNRELNLDGVDLSCRHLECGVRMGVVDIIKENSIERDLDECWQKDFHNYTLLWTPSDNETHIYL
uniref:WSC domain-containing protein n=1 Tax=Clastoptera arizonana TaxID=38151 RepID=A0A1B6DCK0_9HEMI